MSGEFQLWHTIRHADGSWQGEFGLVESQVSGGPPGFAVAGCAGVGDDMQTVGVGTDAQLYHTIRHADGSWQGSFGAEASQVAGGPGEFHYVACGGVGTDLHVVAVGADSKLYHTIRHADGSWQSTFGDVAGQVSGGPGEFFFVGCAGVGDILEVVGVGNDGQLWHTIRNPDGSWQNFFGAVAGQVSGGPGRFSRVGCAGVGDILEVVGVGSDGQLWHTIRNPDGSWQNFFGAVAGVVSGGPAEFANVATGGAGSDLHVIGGNWVGGWL